MSSILDQALDPERCRACALHDAAMLSWAKEQAQRSAAANPLDKVVSMDRRIPFTADCIDSFDAVIAGIEAGAQRVEVAPVLTPEWLRDRGLL